MEDQELNDQFWERAMKRLPRTSPEIEPQGSQMAYPENSGCTGIDCEYFMTGYCGDCRYNPDNEEE